MNIIDCKGLKCPQPVINTKKYFDSIENGEAEVVVDNEVAKNNISKFCNSNGFKFNVEEKEGLYHIKIAKENVSCEVMDFEKNSLVILIGTDKLGNGDDTLGATLMKSYLYALSESDKLPTDLLFLNSGVKLVAEGSEVLDSLNKLKERGVNIASCGVCLDFYKLKEKLSVGEITNMYTIIEKMNTADNTIKL
ncbi:sulfurtransferase-like selenium metabolism protein YedF [Clostridium sp. YIM B02515]|uniref:Sulfurtransferase-like selenium metabolism protein YedF n=1 Tax=Clostridium rhizosphaerae TaxID=2803861 RepID=A0ABS1TGA0_9CLOT|nr:sulfurtransferase-like selenium metabolism protein YedF [Clostridium rhizosphaerae]MBL4938414.1 sulfurtransferase-like selenium metabolism protein YedF [Clostridium rhizosphaerae]